VADIGTSRQSAALVRSIVKIGQTLHLETVAEGVETEEQVDRLVRLGAKLGQGYLFARPLGADELAVQLGIAHSLDPD
jgi:EAL domain-containing protein (putative c-di-GMP-specific phosphodiesterase class I)